MRQHLILCLKNERFETFPRQDRPQKSPRRSQRAWLIASLVVRATGEVRKLVDSIHAGNSDFFFFVSHLRYSEYSIFSYLLPNIKI